MSQQQERPEQNHQNEYFPQEPNESQSWDQLEGDGPVVLPGGTVLESPDRLGWTINVGKDANVTVGRVVRGDQHIDGGLVIGEPFFASQGAEEADHDDSVSHGETTPIDRASNVVTASGDAALQGVGVEFSPKSNAAETEHTTPATDEFKSDSAHDDSTDSRSDKPVTTMRKGSGPLAQDVVSRAYDVFQKGHKSRS